MSIKVRRHIRSNYLGYVAIFIALAIAPAWAASLRPNSVKSKHIKNGQVKTADLGSNAVTSAKLADAQVTAADIASNAVTTSELASNAVTTAKIAAAAVTLPKLADGAVTSAKVADNSLTGGDIDEGTLSGLPATGPAGGDLTDFFPNPHIADGAVNSVKVVDGSLTGADINESTLEIVPDADHLDGLHAAQFLRSDEAASGDLTGNYPAPSIRDGAVNSIKVADNSLTGTDINESTLGLVNDSDQLDGLHATQFLRSDALAQGDLTGNYPAPTIRNGVVGIPKLSFDPATQTELDAQASSHWKLGGNSGTNPATDFLGTTDNQPLNLKANGVQLLRLEPTGAVFGGGNNVIGGSGNSVSAGAAGAAIAGGNGNSVTDSHGTIGGGILNQAGDGDGDPGLLPLGTVSGGQGNTAEHYSFVGGGLNNDAIDGSFNVVSGGQNNMANGPNESTVAGGTLNVASGNQASIGGGALNTASGPMSTIPGGGSNVASGHASFAAGTQASADHQGAFVWGDVEPTENLIHSTAANQFIARAKGNFFLQNDSSLDDQGGFINTSTGAYLTTGGTWTNSSDENLKDQFTPVKPSKVLAKVAALPVSSWQYKAERGVRHLGPTGQDFRQAFGLGADGRHISSVDADGVALAAIKGLDQQNRELTAQVAQLRRKVGGGDGVASTQVAATESPSSVALGLLGAGLLAMGALGTALVLRRHGRLAGHPA